ncbi:hypothetical protein PRIPAC_92498 [Pristionchus pacificus]|uniref:Uncharacterized protein n=1 Tax=Pristionchus pacificus TaxID=54126 RepID=A0A2A6CDE8_PRIPA|nr:hypothetical protein PRIPAC_92498 [Pristionchus pacificus]|eukprot:PDM76137.1 hypothetical protein PRIPAC_39741 [Pristionchus pacificus]
MYNSHLAHGRHQISIGVVDKLQTEERAAEKYERRHIENNREKPHILTVSEMAMSCLAVWQLAPVKKSKSHNLASSVDRDWLNRLAQLPDVRPAPTTAVELQLKNKNTTIEHFA